MALSYKRLLYIFYSMLTHDEARRIAAIIAKRGSLSSFMSNGFFLDLVRFQFFRLFYKNRRPNPSVEIDRDYLATDRPLIAGKTLLFLENTSRSWHILRWSLFASCRQTLSRHVYITRADFDTANGS
jgi:hypothetical protein